MRSSVFTVFPVLPPPDVKEIRRYANCPEGADIPLSECLDGLTCLPSRVCYTVVPICMKENGIDLGFAFTESKGLRKALAGCDSALVFAATVGSVPDRMIKKYSKLSPVKALFWQAIGTERAEALCDTFCRSYSLSLDESKMTLCPRFSPGYGDLPLELQKDVFSLLDCERNIGVVLNDSLLMTPSKSVTAIAGIKRKRKDVSV